MAEKIYFFSEDVDFRIKNKAIMRKWIGQIIENEDDNLGLINFIICSDKYLYKMNVEYLDHDTFTDIISFSLSDEPGLVSGDIFISAERAAENAVKFHTTTVNEIHRLIAHGVLHLVGYDDQSKPDKEQMRKLEDKYLIKLDKMI